MSLIAASVRTSTVRSLYSPRLCCILQVNVVCSRRLLGVSHSPVLNRANQRRWYVARNAMTFHVPHEQTPWWLTWLHYGIFAVGSLIPISGWLIFNDTVPISGRRRVMFVPSAVDHSYAAAHLEEVEKAGGVASPDDPRSRTVNNIGARIAIAISALESEGRVIDDRSDLTASNNKKPLLTSASAVTALASAGQSWNWQFRVVDNPINNAYCVPGGTVVVYDGLLKHIDAEVEAGNLLSREDALATVIAHEVWLTDTSTLCGCMTLTSHTQSLFFK
jgi:hypothetical protein